MKQCTGNHPAGNRRRDGGRAMYNDGTSRKRRRGSLAEHGLLRSANLNDCAVMLRTGLLTLRRSAPGVFTRLSQRVVSDCHQDDSAPRMAGAGFRAGCGGTDSGSASSQRRAHSRRRRVCIPVPAHACKIMSVTSCFICPIRIRYWN